MLSDGNISLTKKFFTLYVRMNSRGVQNMHQIEISYVNNKKIEPSIKNKIRLRENANIHKNI